MKKTQTKKEDPRVKLDDELRMAVDRYNDAYTTMSDNGTTLYIERTRATDLIMHIENLVNSIANRPKEFDAEITEIKTKRVSFTQACEFAKEKLETAKKSALGAGVGVTAGAAVVSVAPTVAMWVATTFGTASTGTAISALSGAAATNAALAWLGGGALAVGGGGMAAGNAFLALAGPVGWGIAGASLLSSIVIFSVKKHRLSKKKKETIESVKNNTDSAKKTAAQIKKMLDELTALRKSVDRQYNECLVNYYKDFAAISKEQRDAAYQDSKPTVAEGMKATVVGAAVEGTTAFVQTVIRKRQSGKKIKDFDRSDWIDIAADSGKGTAKGGIRGASIYFLTNYTATTPSLASAITTAAFGVAEQAHLLRKGEVNEAEFIENSELLCFDASVSAISAFAGQVLIPVPVIGAIIGNAVGTMLYQIGKDSLSQRENKFIEGYLKELAELDKKLESEYRQNVERMNRCYAEYLELVMCTFDPDVEKALDGSAALAKRLGVPDEEILDSYDKIAGYFLD